MIQDLSENKGQIIICKMLLEEWFDAIDTLGNGVLDEFDGIKLFTALHFPDPSIYYILFFIYLYRKCLVKDDDIK